MIKKIEKKLRLNKMLIAKLGTEEKKNIKGGNTLLLTCLCDTKHKSCSLQINCCPPPEEGKAQADASLGC